MIKVGITGQKGFIGQHLYNTLGLFPGEFERVYFQRDFFDDLSKLKDFVGQCDVVVHLAAINRHHDPELIYRHNIDLVKKLIGALELTGNKPHVLFSSSSQEDRDNLYGKSKKDGRELLINWSQKVKAPFTGMVIPNVFGPFGNPYYNSFIATFCHQLINGEQPRIDNDAQVKLIYVSELIAVLLKEIRSGFGNEQLVVNHTAEYSVSDVLGTLELFNQDYYKNGIIPRLNNYFETCLFNTFRSYIDIVKYFPAKYIKNSDPRGAFVEIIHLNIGGQVSFSTTLPGRTRGNHYHTRKIERFSVIKGKAMVQLRKVGTTEVFDFYMDGDSPSYVDIPIWFTHNIKNIGEEELYTIFWINEVYDPNNSDTYLEIV